MLKPVNKNNHPVYLPAIMLVLSKDHTVGKIAWSGVIRTIDTIYGIFLELFDQIYLAMDKHRLLVWQIMIFHKSMIETSIMPSCDRSPGREQNTRLVNNWHQWKLQCINTIGNGMYVLIPLYHGDKHPFSWNMSETQHRAAKKSPQIPKSTRKWVPFKPYNTPCLNDILIEWHKPSVFFQFYFIKYVY